MKRVFHREQKSRRGDAQSGLETSEKDKTDDSRH